MTKIFYSWQSDLPNATNRGLIEKALENAVKAIQQDETIQVEPVVDRDTAGLPGTPDIVQAILEKIAGAAVFVADVSIINQGSPCPTPNPNVLIELGYALRALGPERVILVLNGVFGGPEQLPFDLRQRRVVRYDMRKDASERAPERNRLARTLQEALRTILKNWNPAEKKNPVVPRPSETDFVVINVAGIFDYSIDHVEELLGSPVSTSFRSLGSAEELPDGGQTRVYKLGKWEIAINFDKLGVAKGVMVSGFGSEEDYTLEHWPVTLARIGLTVVKQPDIVAPIVRGWDNYLGYNIRVFARAEKGQAREITSVRVYKLPK